MTPMVFCASLAPWPNETAGGRHQLQPLNGLALSCHSMTFCMPTMRNIARKAMPKATSG